MSKAVSQRYQQPAGIQGQVSLKSDAEKEAEFWSWEEANMQEKITQENRQQSATVNNA